MLGGVQNLNPDFQPSGIVKLITRCETKGKFSPRGGMKVESEKDHLVEAAQKGYIEETAFVTIGFFKRPLTNDSIVFYIVPFNLLDENFVFNNNVDFRFDEKSCYELSKKNIGIVRIGPS